MLNLARGFLGLAQMAQGLFGGPFHAGQVIDQAAVVYDDGGSIVSSDAPVTRSCLVQISAASEMMRQAVGFVEGDVEFVILTESLSGALSTDAVVEVFTGATTPADFVGVWTVSEIELDSVAIGYGGKGRKQ